MYKSVLAIIPYMIRRWFAISGNHKFSKPVAFNRNNPTDLAILNYVKRRNFSGYVKKLIIADMKAKGADVPKYEPTKRTNTAAPQNPPNESKLERLKRQLALAQNVNNDPQSDTDS